MHRPLSAFLILIAALGAAPETVAAQSGGQAGPERFLHWSYQDASAWVTGWNTHRVVTVAAVSAALVPLSFADLDVTRAAGEKARGGFGGFLDDANRLGGPGSVIVPAGVFAYSLLGNDRRFQDAAFTSLQTYLYANALVHLVKQTAGRARPESHAGSHTFHPFSGATSFPSGHTANAFAIVMPWVFYYPGPTTYALVAVAAGTAAARVEREKHWATDVVAGALIGTTMAYFLAKRHGGLARQRISVTPSMGPGSISMSVTVGL